MRGHNVMVQVSEAGRTSGGSGFRGGLEGSLSGCCPEWGVPGTPFLQAETVRANPSVNTQSTQQFSEQKDWAGEV